MANTIGRITPHLWFDKEAKEAAALYVSVFPDSSIKSVRTLHNTPSGECDIVSFELSGQPFMSISAGPLFKFNPSISFHVKCKTRAEVDAVWEKLSAGGTVLMELGKYPFSERYGWCNDRYGLSWQVMLAGESDFKQKITPVLMFVGSVCGKAEEAVNFYTSLFGAKGFLEPASVGSAKREGESGGDKPGAFLTVRYGKGEEPDKEGTLKFAGFALRGQEFGAMDSAHKHPFAFNEAISFIVHCDTQGEIDHYWDKLSAVPASEQCGWLKDRYGLVWQIVPSAMAEMLQDKDERRLARVTQAFLKMKKFNIADLEKAYKGG